MDDWPIKCGESDLNLQSCPFNVHFMAKCVEPNLLCGQATVLEVKEKLVALTNIPTDRQRLIFRGAVLQDTQGLATARKLPPTLQSPTTSP